jgi:hypothetical protein
MRPWLEMLLSRGAMIRAGVLEKIAMQISGHETEHAVAL